MALQNDSLIVRFRASASRIQGNEFAIQLYPLTNVSRGPCNVLIGSVCSWAGFHYSITLLSFDLQAVPSYIPRDTVLTIPTYAKSVLKIAVWFCMALLTTDHLNTHP